MSGRFQIFRLSLLPRFQRDFLVGPDPSRESYLQEVFRRDWEFHYWSSQFHYVFDKRLSSENAILGRLGKATISAENMSPENGLTETMHEGWKACVIAIDPKDHADGQKISVQVDLKVGKPFSIISAFIDHINRSNSRSAYEIEINPIFDSQSFWDFAKTNKGQITRLEFDFTTPNGLWSTESNLKSELKSAREKFNAKKVINAFVSNDGLNVDNDEIQEAVAYAEAGSATVKAKTKTNRKYNSTTQQKTSTLEKDDMLDETMIVKAARQISRVFGRE